MKRGFTLLLAEDDENDILLFEHALTMSAEKASVSIRLEVTRGGEEAIRYLKGEGEFRDREKHPFPDIFITDLKMSGLSGFDVLAWLKRHEEYQRLPKIVMSASCVDSDMDQAYRLGANTFFKKTTNLKDFAELIYCIVCYWSRTEKAMIRQPRSEAVTSL
jgi:CheY-like chemotaxis protein